jgi:hypothetical protein
MSSEKAHIEQLRKVTEPDEELGTKMSPVFDRVIVDSRAWDESNEPAKWLTELKPGDSVCFRGKEAKITSLGLRRNYGQRGLHRIGLRPDVVGTVATLVVDRDPYLLDVCNGPIYAVDPSEVERCV